LSDEKRTNHAEWGCTYHVIFIPKYRKKVLYGKLRYRLGAVFQQLAHRMILSYFVTDDPRN
jgi:putative transposase